MSKHRYRITVEYLSDPQGNIPGQPPLRFEADSHDNIFTIVDKTKARNEFSPDSAQAFAVGLKLFSEVLLENKDKPLFASFLPHFGQFMKGLKQPA